MPPLEVEESRGDFGPAPCPVCGSIGARAWMLDHIEEVHPDIGDVYRRYRELQEQTGQALVRAHVARGAAAVREAKSFERMRELEEVLRRAVRIVARRESSGNVVSREGRDFIADARKILADDR